MNKAQRLLTALQNGDQLTNRQIESRFNVTSGRALVHELRNSGYPVYLNRHVNSKGAETLKYRIGAPSRQIIAAGYRALGADAAFNTNV